MQGNEFPQKHDADLSLEQVCTGLQGRRTATVSIPAVLQAVWALVHREQGIHALHCRKRPENGSGLCRKDFSDGHPPDLDACRSGRNTRLPVPDRQVPRVGELNCGAVESGNDMDARFGVRIQEIAASQTQSRTDSGPDPGVIRFQTEQSPSPEWRRARWLCGNIEILYCRIEVKY